MRLLFLLVLFPLLVKSQDTIFFINKSIEVGKIIEIGVNEVKYKRSNNLDGPLFVRLKSDIQYIKYANGEIDKIIHAPNAKAGRTILNQEFYTLDFQNNVLYYRSKPVGDRKLLKLIQEHPTVEKRKPLKIEFDKMKRYRVRQYTWGIAGPVTAGYILGIGFSLALVETSGPGSGPNAVTYLVAGVAAGACVLTVSLNQSKTNRSKRIAQKLKIANMYNDI